MHDRFYTYVLRLFLALFIASALPSPASVVFRPKNHGKYAAAGEEEINGSAQQLFEMGAADETSHPTRAIQAYNSLVRRYPKDALAGAAAYRAAVLIERHGDPLKAANAYLLVVQKYPKSPNFDEAIEGQFRIGEMFLNGKKIKILGIPIKASLDSAIQIFGAIVQSAPYGKYTARAQFNIGRANEKQGNADLAVAAYTAVVEKFPNDPIAVDAQYQIGYLWFKTTGNGTYDAKARANAKTGFSDFLFRYPKSEKAAQARDNLRMLEEKQTSDAFQIAKFYDKQKNYRAAVIYYNDVIRQQPGSTQSDEAKQRVSELRAKVGDANLAPPFTGATAKKTEKPSSKGREPSSSGPPMMTSPGDVAPLPPPEVDESLPPPASLTPNKTLAPDVPAATASPTPEATASPGE